MTSNTSAPRYAIYFVSDPETELYRIGASVLGYDVYTGRDVPFIASAGARWPENIREPCVYGFHATLKPPFRLAENFAPSDLKTAFDAFAKSKRAVDMGLLKVQALSSFIALVPAAPCPALDELAGACVKRFEHFRASMNGEERARRLAATLTERQQTNLDRWGYPYVFEDFRFHMTLTGPLADSDRVQALQWLKAEFASRPAAQDLILNRLVIARLDGGAFYVVRSASLGT